MDNQDKLRFVSKIPEEYCCSLCTILLNNPVLTDCCGQHFCKVCLENWFLRKQPKEFENVWTNGSYQKKEVKCCPKCGVRNFNYITYLPIRKKINSLTVYCPNRSKGCKETAQYGNYQEHVAKCRFQNIYCDQCGQGMLRKEIENHKKNECSYRQVKCPYCDLEGTYIEITTDVHHDKCPSFPLPCPNNCGESDIERKDIEAHKQVCPNEVVKCSFFVAGCCELKQKDLEDHVASNERQHLDLVMKKLANTQQQLDDLTVKTMVLEQKLNTLTSGLASEIQDLDTTISQTNYPYNSQQGSKHIQAIECMQTTLAMAGKILFASDKKYRVRFTWDSSSGCAQTMPFYIYPGYKFYLKTGPYPGSYRQTTVKLLLIRGEHDINIEWPPTCCFVINLTLESGYGRAEICPQCNKALQSIEQPANKSEQEVFTFMFQVRITRDSSQNGFHVIMLLDHHSCKN